MEDENMTNRIHWDQYFMAQSLLISTRSTCTRLAVGATIVRNKRVISGGYNGSVSGDVHCSDAGCKIVDGHCVRTVHAEANAILQCAKFGAPTEGADIYVSYFPCLQCTKMIIQAGIENLYYLHDYNNSEYAKELLDHAEKNIIKVKITDDFFQKVSVDFTK